MNEYTMNKNRYGYRICSKCKIEYLLSDIFFHKGSKSNKGFCHTCKKCRAIYEKGIRKTIKCPNCTNLMLISSNLCKQCMLKNRNFGENNPMWKGGRHKDTRGYVQILSYYHPNKSTKGYVYEHRLIMEKELGRYLRKEEIIHHKNGIIDDNRIENLELCIKSQPPRQRVEDLVIWAREIINEYGYLFS